MFKRALFLIIFLISTFIFAAENSMDFYYKGKENMRMRDYFSAIQNFQKSLEQNKYYLDAILGIAEAYYYIGEYDEASSYVLEAKKLNPNDMRISNLDGRVLLSLGKINEAKAIFDGILEKEPYNIDAIIGQANFFLSRGNTSMALQTYLGDSGRVGAYKINPNDKRVLLALAFLYDDMKRPKAALEYVERAIKIDPYDPITYSVASEINYKNGFLDKAFEYSKIALSYEPNDQQALLLKSYIDIKAERFSDAQDSLNRLLTVDKRDADALYTMSYLFNKMGNYKDSINFLNRIFEINADDEIARLLLKENIKSLYSTDLEAQDRKDAASYYKNMAISSIKHNYYLNGLLKLEDALELDPRNLELMGLRADIVLAQGYKSKFLSYAEVFLNEAFRNSDLGDFQAKKIDIEDKKETYELLNRDSVSNSWGMDVKEQFTGVSDKFEFQIFYNEQNQSLKHFHSEEVLSRYLENIMDKYPNIEFKSFKNSKMQLFPATKVQDFAEAFSTAQKNELDYFIMVNFLEDEGIFYTKVQLYLTRTGKMIQEFNVENDGNFKVQNSFYKIASEISNLLPYRGRIMNLDFQRALINLGKMDGVAVGDKFVVLKEADLILDKDKVSILYDTKKILANIIVTKIDDKICEGNLEKASVADLASIGDKVILNKKSNFDTTNNTLNMFTNVSTRGYKFPMLYNKIKRIE